MKKYIVFGIDSNFGAFREEFTNKKRAYGFYMHMMENANYIDIIEKE